MSDALTAIPEFSTEAELAEILCIDPRHVRRLAKEGTLPNKTAKGFNSLRCVMAFCGARAQASSRRATMEEEKLRKTTLEADALQRAKDVDERRLIPSPDVDAFIDEAFSVVRTEFENDYGLTIPSRCAGKDSGQIRKITDELFAERCRTLQKRKFLSVREEDEE